MNSQRVLTARRERSQRPGFTVVELLLVLMIAGVLGTIAVPQFASFMARRSVVNARDNFALSASRARAAAVERGDVVVLFVRPYQDSIVVMSADMTDTIEVLNFRDGEIQVDVVAPTAVMVCYLPRGFAHPGCGSGNSLPRAIGFAFNSDTLYSIINAIGQVERQ